jgi:hypothetical protein
MVLTTAALLLSVLTGPMQASEPQVPEYERQILLKVGASVPVGELEQRLALLGVDGQVRAAFGAAPSHMVDRVGIGRIHVLEVAATERDAVLARLADQPWLAWAEANLGGHGLTGGTLVPNDASFSTQWCLDQFNDIDMDMPEAWDAQGGFDVSQMTVAVIDTGILQGGSYPDLAGMPWAHPGEIPGNAVDDDGNGFVDDVTGYDFVRDDGNPNDEHGHGTAVTSIMSGHANNGADLAGVAPGVEIMVVKVFNEFGDFPVSGPYAGHLSVAAGLIYAADNGAILANNSWGVFTGFSQVVADAVEYALDNQIHLVFAAGNFNEDTFFPAEMEGVIAVAAIDSAGVKSDWGGGTGSSFGAWVDVSAGGTLVPAYWFFPGIFLFNGTSMASPNAAGVALMALDHSPDLSQEDLRSLLMQASVSVDALNPAFVGLLGSGHVNAYNTVRLLEPVADLGNGLSGNTTPHLNVWGETQPGGVITASISSATPSASGGLVVGLGQVNAPFKGGVLVPTPDLILILATDGDGAWRIDAPVATGVPTGASLYLQGIVSDAGALKNFAFTTGKSYTGL